MPQQSRIERSGLIDVGQMPGVGNDVDGRAGNQILQRPSLAPTMSVVGV